MTNITQVIGGEKLQTSEMYVAYNIARVETEVRKSKVTKPTAENLIAAQLGAGMALDD